MPNYRRARVPGGTYFFTVNLVDRDSRLLVEHVDALRGAFRDARAVRPFGLIAAVVLPNHLHCIWKLPEGDADNARRWGAIKAGFSRALPMEAARSRSRGHRGERSIWQRRFWERWITDERDLQAHVDYVHGNPVRHGLVDRANDWPYSSFHRHVRQGLLAPDWAAPASTAPQNAPVPKGE
ncbi:REP-associated tyrosine transposase [Pseudomarimonas salicorniae]|uniref:Transposase n=1 Tax=Pseudomarimonas salicorniae TaxID=2933270 RepID=A0ABT0GLC3_9GAMM|nr:transposase [Lysobacter sp. CAU 1642]MCK7595346.1 transposase [Lysobacter sp. CAU 1642]